MKPNPCNFTHIDPNSTEWEGLCKRCGRCCYEKIEFEGRVYYTDKPCDRLDPDTLLCTVYLDRHVIKPECTPLTGEILQRGILPRDCPYVAGIVGYSAPQLWEDDGE